MMTNAHGFTVSHENSSLCKMWRMTNVRNTWGKSAPSCCALCRTVNFDERRNAGVLVSLFRSSFFLCLCALVDFCFQVTRIHTDACLFGPTRCASAVVAPSEATSRAKGEAVYGSHTWWIMFGGSGMCLLLASAMLTVKRCSGKWIAHDEARR